MVIRISFWGGQPQHAKETPSSNKRLTPADVGLLCYLNMCNRPVP